MSKPKKVEIDLSRPYEDNDIKLRGTVIFCTCTFVMIVLSFVIIWFMNQWVNAGMADYEKKNLSPMALDKIQQLPPEPRLQLAPGFGVGEGENRINLELQNPHSEWIEMHKRWQEAEEHGVKDPHTGAVISIPMDEAKAKMLESAAKQRPAEEAQKSLTEAKSIYTTASGGTAMGTR
jgi:hypothetical protein